MKKLLLLASFLVMPMLHGCGYSSVVKDSVIPADRSLYVAMFDNRTYQPNIEAELRQAFVSTLVSRGGKLDGELSDYTLSGEILSLSTGGTAFSGSDTVKYYTLVMTVQATLTERKSNKVIWKGEEVIRQGYPANNDLALLRNAHDAAVTTACANAAKLLVARMNQKF